LASRIATADVGETASGEKAGFDTMRTNQACVIGHVARHDVDVELVTSRHAVLAALTTLTHRLSRTDSSNCSDM